MRELNKMPWFHPKSLVPLVGFDRLPDGFQFQINMYQFGGMRCFAIVSVPCLAECLSALGVGGCERLVHEAIYQQAHDGQISFPWVRQEDDLPTLIEVFSKHGVELEHFDGCVKRGV